VTKQGALKQSRSCLGGQISVVLKTGAPSNRSRGDLVFSGICLAQATVTAEPGQSTRFLAKNVTPRHVVYVYVDICIYVNLTCMCLK
jgi:hypothetical protein